MPKLEVLEQRAQRVQQLSRLLPVRTRVQPKHRLEMRSTVPPNKVSVYKQHSATPPIEQPTVVWLQYKILPNYLPPLERWTACQMFLSQFLQVRLLPKCVKDTTWLKTTNVEKSHPDVQIWQCQHIPYKPTPLRMVQLKLSPYKEVK